jgi:hypothetical protein
VVTGSLAFCAAAIGDPGQKSGAGAKSKTGVKRKNGQLPTESDEKYEKRRDLMIKRAEKDKDGFFTLEAQPFIVRTDISAEFTVETALFMQMLHREYGSAYKSLGLPPGPPKEWIEVLVYLTHETYMARGGPAGAGGHFRQWIFTDRPPNWKSRHYRLEMFTSGEEKFEKWEKSTLKHEAAHMELQMRLGFFVDSPRWFNEGQASCFEYWDFDKSVEENLKLIPTRGRYAPVIRRLWDTPEFKPFSYVWDIDPASWHADMTNQQGALNYCQAWSLAAFMLNQGRDGAKAFRTIYGLSKRVGADRRVGRRGVKTLAWQSEFPAPEQKKIEEQWMAWIKSNLPKNKKNADEREGLIDLGYDPDAKGLRHLTKERYEELTAKDVNKFGKNKKKKKSSDDDEDDDDKTSKIKPGDGDDDSGDEGTEKEDE